MVEDDTSHHVRERRANIIDSNYSNRKSSTSVLLYGTGTVRLLWPTWPYTDQWVVRSFALQRRLLGNLILTS